MNTIKLSLTISVQGADMLSEQECSKQLKKPVIFKKGKYAGKPVLKNGHPIYKTINVPDFDKHDENIIRVSYKDPETHRTVWEDIHFYTRKCKEVEQVINMTDEAYNYFISKEVPDGYKAPYEFKADRKLWKKGINPTTQAWMQLSQEQKLMWHLTRIAEDKHGVVKSYKVFDD